MTPSASLKNKVEKGTTGMYPIIVILAKAESEGVKGKNSTGVKVGGLSLLGRAVTTSGLSKFGDVYVYSDCPKALDLSAELGAIPVHRPAHWATLDQGSEEVVAHFLSITRFDRRPDPVCLVQLTSPFLRVEDLNRAFDTIEDEDYDSAVAASRFHGYLGIGGTSGIWEAISPKTRKLRQDMQTIWLETGMFYLADREQWISGSRFGETPKIIEIEDPNRGIEIDTMEDLAAARSLARVYDKNTWVEFEKKKRP